MRSSARRRLSLAWRGQEIETNGIYHMVILMCQAIEMDPSKGVVVSVVRGASETRRRGFACESHDSDGQG